MRRRAGHIRVAHTLRRDEFQDASNLPRRKKSAKGNFFADALRASEDSWRSALAVVTTRENGI